MSGAEKSGKDEDSRGYTRRPKSASPPASRSSGHAPALAAAALTFAVIAASILHLQRPPVAAPTVPAAVATVAQAAVPIAAPAPTPAPPAAPAAGGSVVDSVKLIVHEIDPPAPAPAVVVAPAPAAASRPRYLSEGYLHMSKAPEPEEVLPPTRVYIDYFYERLDGAAVAGTDVAVLVDGVPGRVPIRRATVPGMFKAVVTVPPDGRTHTVVFAPYYDLGADGLVQVREIMTRTPGGDMTYVVETPVDRAVFRHGGGRRPVRLK